MGNGKPIVKKKSSIGVKASAAEAGKYTREAGVLAYYEVHRIFSIILFTISKSRFVNYSNIIPVIVSIGIKIWVFHMSPVNLSGSVLIMFEV